MTHVETWIRYGFAALRFVDATTAVVPTNDGNAPRPQPASVALNVALDDLPQRVRRDDRPGLIAFDFGDLHAVEGREITEADRAHVPAEVMARTLRLKGKIHDPSRRFHPRVLAARDVTVGNVVDVELYPTPAATRAGGAGELHGIASLGDDDSSPAKWCTLRLTVAVAPSRTYTFRAQADVRGEFRISLTGLPPLPKGADPYDGALTVLLPNANASDTHAPDPSDLSAAHFVSPDEAPAITTTQLDTLPVSIRYGARVSLTTPRASVLRVAP